MIGFNQINITEINDIKGITIHDLSIGKCIAYFKSKSYSLLFNGHIISLQFKSKIFDNLFKGKSISIYFKSKILNNLFKGK